VVGLQSADTTGPASPARRVIVLGASNATRGLSSLVGAAQRAWGTPLDVLAAIGHGRSYGMKTRVLGRALPGILECRLWDELAQRPPAATAALVTDIGNDLLYGTDVPVILSWLHSCLERLQHIADRLVITRLPLTSIDRCPDWQLRLLIFLLFPGARIEPGDARARAIELDRQLIACAGQYRAYVVQPDRHWYGWDPIHVARTQRSLAWQKYLMPWTDGTGVTPASRSCERWLACLRARPRQWTFLNICRERAQPCARLSDGTTISLY
jgi:hypothetical protein